MKSKKGGKIQESIQSNTTPDPRVTKIQLNVTSKSQEVGPFPAGDHKAAMNGRESMTNTRGPQGFWGSWENGYLFTGSWGALIIILGELGSKLIILGI